MARIRTIKPEFWTDEKLAPLSPIDRLVFLGLISMADDSGRVLDNVKIIDAFVFAESSDSSRESLATLSRLSRITRGKTSSGQSIIQIVNWSKHQKVDKPSFKACLPEIAETLEKQGDSNDSRESRESLATDSRESRDRTNDQRPTTNDQRPTTNDHIRQDFETIETGNDAGEPACGGLVDLEKDFLETWNTAMVQKCQWTSKRRKLFKTRIGEKFFKENWRDALFRASKCDFLRGGGSQGWSADINWFLRPDSIVAILEGKYDNRKPVKRKKPLIEF